MIGVRYGELSIEPALPVAELIGIDAIAQLKASDSGAFGDDGACAVSARHQREMRTAWFPPGPITDRGVPTADTNRVEFDHNFMRAWLRHRQPVRRENRWRTKTIDRYSLHAAPCEPPAPARTGPFTATFGFGGSHRLQIPFGILPQRLQAMPRLHPICVGPQVTGNSVAVAWESAGS